ncbi:MAG: phosphatase PAP2 family protein [Muribaculaceae bacterium]|nr:phosphatase PAP2 family protein [Muribaculaceae bacterium]
MAKQLHILTIAFLLTAFITRAQDSIGVNAMPHLSLDLDTTRLSLYEPHHGMDFTFLKNTTNPEAKPYKFLDDQTWTGIPVFLAGMIAKSEKTAFRQDYNNPDTKIRLIKYDFHTEIDNYTQFSGIALTAGLKMAGVEGRSSWPRLFASSLASYAVMATFVNSIKYTASEMRPDGSTRNSWPSGHTATAFVGATILHKEYGLTRSPWYSIAGYSVATATGVMRVLNNRHWVSDVLSSAGIGILSTELAYGFCDMLFKDKGLLMNNLANYTDLYENPSFFSISMGIGIGNKNLTLPAFDYGIPEGLDIGLNLYKEPIELKFRSSTAVGVEGAWFFCPYVGIGGRLRVKSTPINGWSKFSDIEGKAKQEMDLEPIYKNAVRYFGLYIESDHVTEFAGDAGVYFSLPFSSRLALGSKLLMGRSVMDNIDIDGVFTADRIVRDAQGNLVITDYLVYCNWDYIDVSASNSMKFGTGLSLTYAHKNSFSWRVFCDYDYSKKTYTATYSPFIFIEDFSHELRERMIQRGWDPVQTFTSSTLKHLHQWVFGGALCVSF